MRRAIIILSVFGILLSCNNTETNSLSSDTVSANSKSDTTTNKTERQLLIEELKRLEAAFGSNDKEKIGNIFQFPLSNSTVGISIDDSTFNAQYQKNGDKATRTMFIQFFPQISESLNIAGLNQLFKNIKLDSLLYKDTLERQVIIRTQPCYNYYSIGIEKDIVTLTIGMDSNKDYKSKTTSEDDITENSSEICEHVLWWLFKFDGKKLHFNEISGAG